MLTKFGAFKGLFMNAAQMNFVGGRSERRFALFLDYYCLEPSGLVINFVPMERSRGYVATFNHNSS